MNRVSIIIPCYNHAEYLEETIISAFHQTYKNIEIIVVNDGSDYENEKKIRGIEKKFSSVTFYHINNSGLSNARNYGIEKSTGRYIFPLDSDDLIHETFIEKAVDIMGKYNDVGIVYANFRYFGASEEERICNVFTESSLIMNNYISACSMFRKKDWELCGGYKSNMEYGMEDWDLWVSIAELGKKAYKINEILFFYRKKDKSMITEMNSNLYKRIFMNMQLIINNKHVYKNMYNNSRVYKDFKNLLSFITVETESNNGKKIDNYFFDYERKKISIKLENKKSYIIKFNKPVLFKIYSNASEKIKLKRNFLFSFDDYFISGINKNFMKINCLNEDSVIDIIIEECGNEILELTNIILSRSFVKES
ncbi:MAG: glycosyltransferase family 2 protein [Candidatus Muirbacterium halophilum]|nr:glycosyltransferase family 2 protein [Candidatus Muirbacterium halophilum]